MSYSDPEDSDDDVDVGAEGKLDGGEMATEGMRLTPSAFGSKTSASGSGTSSSTSSRGGSSGGKTTISPNSSRQLEMAAMRGAEEERSENSSGFRITPEEPGEAAKSLGSLRMLGSSEGK